MTRYRNPERVWWSELITAQYNHFKKEALEVRMSIIWEFYVKWRDSRDTYPLCPYCGREYVENISGCIDCE